MWEEKCLVEKYNIYSNSSKANPAMEQDIDENFDNSARFSAHLPWQHELHESHISFLIRESSQCIIDLFIDLLGLRRIISDVLDIAIRGSNL